MANPQPDKFVKISTEYFAALCKTRIKGEARQVLDVIIRKTWGWNKKTDKISLSQFEEETGLDRGNVGRSLRYLQERNMIVVNRDDSYITLYGVQKDFEKWKD